MKLAAALAAFAVALVADGLDSGYRITNLQLQGPTEWRRSVDPVWVSEYPTLRLRYKATGPPAADTPVLTLRPGSVGPVTPGATNRENPFADGLPVVVLRSRDLAGKDQVEVDLRGKFKTPQIDQLQFSLPAGRRDAILHLEEAPPDTLGPFYDAAFSYNMVRADRRLSPLKLSLFRFAFPEVRLWDMLSIGVQPRVLSLEDFRLSLWHGNGAWLKGRLETWYGEEILAFLKRARQLLGENAAAFAGQAEPMVESPDPVIFINHFQGGRQTVFTLFNASYRTRRLMFQGRSITLGPRDVDVVRLP